MSGEETENPLLGEQEKKYGSLGEGEEELHGNDELSLSAGFESFSDSDDTFRLCIVAIVVYLASGVIAYSFVFEKWSIIDSLYFGVVTFTTVGYGDLYPTEPQGRIFLIFYVLFGIIILGVALGIIGDKLVAANEAALEKTRKKNQEKVMNTFGGEESEEAAAAQTQQYGVSQQSSGFFFFGPLALIMGQQSGSYNASKTNSLWQDLFELLSKDMPLVLLIAVVSIVIGKFEGWSILTSLYFCVITTTTVGYGDVAPVTPAMRLFSVIFIPISVAVLTQVLGRIAGFYMERKADEAEQAFLNRGITMEDIRVMDKDGDGSVGYGEYLSFMLVAMQKADIEDLLEIRELFTMLDADNSGYLQKEDLLLMQNMGSKKNSNEETPEVV